MLSAIACHTPPGQARYEQAEMEIVYLADMIARQAGLAGANKLHSWNWEKSGSGHYGSPRQMNDFG